MPSCQGESHRDMWRAYLESSLLLETRLDHDLRTSSGLSLIDYHVLLLLSEADGHRLRMGELAARMVFSASRATYQVKSMERSGLVLRQSSVDDGRGSDAVLTASGLEALRDAAPKHASTVKALFTEHLDVEERDVITRVFNRLWQRLNRSDVTDDPEPRANRDEAPAKRAE